MRGSLLLRQGKGGNRVLNALGIGSPMCKINHIYSVKKYACKSNEAQHIR
jgi:hypothetical protein